MMHRPTQVIKEKYINDRRGYSVTEQETKEKDK
jgi:hypothetical protein